MLLCFLLPTERNHIIKDRAWSAHMQAELFFLVYLSSYFCGPRVARIREVQAPPLQYRRFWRFRCQTGTRRVDALPS